MNKNVFMIMIASCFLFSSCATIFGGRKYNAIIKTNRPNAEIWVNGEYIGVGNAVSSFERKNANKLNITLKEKGCEDSIFKFRSRKIRGFALAGAIAPWALFAINLIPALSAPKYTYIYPDGSISYGGNQTTFFLYLLSAYYTAPGTTDFINFSTMYKPDIKEAGVYKRDYKNYEYRLQSTCLTKENLSEKKQLKGTVYLKNGSIIKGLLVELIPNLSIKLQTIDGSIFVFKFEEIEKYTQE